MNPCTEVRHAHEAKTVGLERMVGRQGLEIEFLKGALKNVPPDFRQESFAPAIDGKAPAARWVGRDGDAAGLMCVINMLELDDHHRPAIVN